MTGFLLGVAVLLLLALGLVFWRRQDVQRAADAGDPNLRWYLQRRSELENQSEVLLEEARLRLLEDGALADDGGPKAPLGTGTVPRWLLGALVLLLSVAIYWHTGAVEDVLIYEDLAALTPEDGDAARAALLARIEARSAAREDNLQYLGLLGRLYMSGEDYAGASKSFARLAEKAPEDPQVLALAAQARFLAADRQLDSEAQLLAERALSIDPAQRTALGLLGMASFEKGVYPAAVTYWGRLRQLEEPGSPGYEMLGEVIAVARERGGLSADTPAGPIVKEGGSVDAGQVGISVALSLAEESVVDPRAVVFVFARRADATSRMPIAVRRLQASDLPITLRLSDGDAMAGQLLSEAGPVQVSAQVSANGQPGAANALYSGAAGPVAAGGDEVAVQIKLQATAQRG
jgi:cytochrome c-type biogenesis protein CcmH